MRVFHRHAAAAHKKPYALCEKIMLLIALTGGIACGKSTAANWLKSPPFSLPTLDTDDVAHELQNTAEVKEILKKEFGTAERPALARIVFADRSALLKLNSIMHPLILRETLAWIERLPNETPAAAVIVPLLFETNFLLEKFSATVAIVASAETQIARLIGRGLDENAARARIAAQMPCEEKARRATAAIQNDGSKEQFRENFCKTIKSLL